MRKIPEDEMMKLKGWYLYYHKLATCYKSKYKKFKSIKLALNITSTPLIALGSVLTPFTHFTSLSITGVGVILQSYIAKSNTNRKIESCKFAYTNYNKILTQVNTYMNGFPYDEAVFLSDTKVLDDIVIDTCPTINGISDRYDRIYLQQSCSSLTDI